MQKSDFYLKISILLKEKNMTQTDLAKKIGVTQASLSKVLSGNMATTVNTARKIAKALEVPISYLLEDDEEYSNNLQTKQINSNADINFIIELINKNNKLIEEQNKVIQEMNKKFESEIELIKIKLER